MYIVSSFDCGGCLVADVFVKYLGRLPVNQECGHVFRDEVMHILLPERVDFVVAKFDVVLWGSGV